jgi:hypothetical protein
LTVVIEEVIFLAAERDVVDKLLDLDPRDEGPETISEHFDVVILVFEEGLWFHF